jgi:hypothetical protein
VESGLLLNVVVSEGSPDFEMLASENDSLLIGRDAFLVLDLLLDVFNGVRRLDFDGNSLSGECFDVNLHAWFVCVCVWRMRKGKEKKPKKSFTFAESINGGEGLADVP